MIFDARSLPENKNIESDICIVGAGAAGITLAREFIGAPFRVSLLESGGLEYDEDTQSLYKGENLGIPYFSLVSARLRYFGGSTNHWGGWCRPLDEIDFEQGDWVPYSGWPFKKAHLDPFYKRAQPICELGPYNYYDSGVWTTKNAPAFPFARDRVRTKFYQYSPPTKFGKVYRDEIKQANNISTYLYSNVVDIETNDTARNVTRLRVACLPGNKFWVSAKIYILATGGIENPRLLLLSNKISQMGLGNQNDLVGRFFLEHPHVHSGYIHLSSPHKSVTTYTEVKKIHQVKVRGLLTLSPETLRREKLANFSATINQSFPEPAIGVRSLKFIIKRFIAGEMPDNFVNHLGNVIADLDDIAVAAYRHFYKIRPPNFLFRLNNRIEQVPNPDSRVVLLKDRDRLGKNRPGLEWRLSPLDKITMRRAHEIIGEEVGFAGLGRFKVTLSDDDHSWPLNLIGGPHHMGTTRIHVDPKRGVVDENCRVHGISNLFIAGSSIFPTVGYANPTLTIVALSIRLADHLKKVMT